MPRKQPRSRRWLPENVSKFRDRHGKLRYRFRKTGLPTYYFKNAPGTAEFMAEYRQAQQGRKEPASKLTPYSYSALIDSFYRTPAWTAMRPSSVKTYRSIIERFRAKNGEKDVRRITTAAIDAKLSGMADTPAAANNLRKVLRRLHRHAIKLGWRIDNPVDATDSFKSGKGFHAWSEAEIAAFAERWPIGTKERLAMEMLLWTALRKGDVITLGRQHRQGDELHLHHGKNESSTIIFIPPQLQAAMDAFDSGNLTYIATEYGKPYTSTGFYNWFKRACVKAGIPHCSPHGLRKAASRRLAEAGATPLEGRAVTGHKTDKMFAYYAETANKKALAGVGMNKVMANLGKQVSQTEPKK